MLKTRMCPGSQPIPGTSKRAIQYDVAVAGAGDNLRVAVLDLRQNHRNIVFSGPTQQTIADFDAAYATLLSEIDRLEQIGIAQFDVTQTEVIRQRAQEYHDAFRPRIVLFTSDPVSFNAASNTGLTQIDELERIQQAVLIRVDNAARVSPASGPVELRSSVGDGCLAIDVIDRGPGVPAEERERIFERFHLVGPSRTRQQGSAGLGLSITKSIIDAHHGRIEIASTQGNGTRMTIHLPFSQET